MTHGTRKTAIATHCRRGMKIIILIEPIALADSCKKLWRRGDVAKGGYPARRYQGVSHLKDGVTKGKILGFGEEVGVS